MAWEVNGTEEFADWFDGLTEPEQGAVIAVEKLYEQHLADIEAAGLFDDTD